MKAFGSGLWSLPIVTPHTRKHCVLAYAIGAPCSPYHNCHVHSISFIDLNNDIIDVCIHDIAEKTSMDMHSQGRTIMHDIHQLKETIKGILGNDCI